MATQLKMLEAETSIGDVFLPLVPPRSASELEPWKPLGDRKWKFCPCKTSTRVSAHHQSDCQETVADRLVFMRLRTHDASLRFKTGW